MENQEFLLGVSMNHKALMRSANTETHFNSDIWLTALHVGGTLEELVSEILTSANETKTLTARLVPDVSTGLRMKHHSVRVTCSGSKEAVQLRAQWQESGSWPQAQEGLPSLQVHTSLTASSVRQTQQIGNFLGHHFPQILSPQPAL